MKIILIQSTFALPIWYRLSYPGEGWNNGNQFNSSLEKTPKTPTTDYQTATMGGFVTPNGGVPPSVGEPVQSDVGNVQSIDDGPASDARIVSSKSICLELFLF